MLNVGVCVCVFHGWTLVESYSTERQTMAAETLRLARKLSFAIHSDSHLLPLLNPVNLSIKKTNLGLMMLNDGLPGKV
jgi:hypothetical protein